MTEKPLPDKANIVITEDGINPKLLQGSLPVTEVSEKVVE